MKKISFEQTDRIFNNTSWCNASFVNKSDTLFRNREGWDIICSATGATSGRKKRERPPLFISNKNITSSFPISLHFILFYFIFPQGWTERYFNRFPISFSPYRSAPVTMWHTFSPLNVPRPIPIHIQVEYIVEEK